MSDHLSQTTLLDAPVCSNCGDPNKRVKGRGMCGACYEADRRTRDAGYKGWTCRTKNCRGKRVASRNECDDCRERLFLAGFKPDAVHLWPLKPIQDLLARRLEENKTDQRVVIVTGHTVANALWGTNSVNTQTIKRWVEEGLHDTEMDVMCLKLGVLPWEVYGDAYFEWGTPSLSADPLPSSSQRRYFQESLRG